VTRTGSIAHSHEDENGDRSQKQKLARRKWKPFAHETSE